ncbi:unnamed protein product [Taenia asiatica]|uniref:Fork-head domain-containing protein n=1 Tax=Taenia asiatica TaxID=60517 RepID=A0A3P6PL86_TAEAS|nr:unnamed protein product [Taenia asiatica]
MQRWQQSGKGCCTPRSPAFVATTHCCFCCYHYDDSEAAAVVVVVAVVVRPCPKISPFLRAPCPSRLCCPARRYVGSASACAYLRARVNMRVERRGAARADSQNNSPIALTSTRPHTLIHPTRRSPSVGGLVRSSVPPLSHRVALRCVTSSGWPICSDKCNSIRHNLSLHDKFVKCPKASESSKSSYWRLNANSLNRPYVRRRTCSLDTPGSVVGGGGGGVGGKKAKSRLGGGGSGAAGSTSAAKRAAQMAAAAAAAAAGGGGGGGGSRGEIKSGGGLYGGDDLLASLQSGGSSAATVRSHLNSLSSGIASAFSIPSGGGSDTLLGLKPDPGPGLNHHPWTNSGFLTDRKPPNDELSALCKMQTSDSVSSSSLSLMSGGGGGGYEFQVPRPPPSSSTRSSFSSSGIGSDRGSSFFSPPPPPPPPQSGRYHHHHHHQAFSHEQQQRYGSLCDASPTAASTNTTPTTTYDQLTGILTGSAECLDGGADPFLRDDPHQLQHHHQPPPPSMSHHHHHHHHQHPPPPPPPTNSHLHNLLMCGDSSGGVSGSALPSTIHGGNENQQQPLSSQDAMELRISLEIANRVKSGEMSSTMQQWAAVAASAARTVENGV